MRDVYCDARQYSTVSILKYVSLSGWKIIPIETCHINNFMHEHCVSVFQCNGCIAKY